MRDHGIRIEPIAGIGEVRSGDRIGELVSAGRPIPGGAVLVISQKVVSKSEGRIRRLSEVEPGPEALELAASTGRDPALVELILGESRSVIRATAEALIVETRSGLICANAGIDASNMATEGEVALLPEDPDASARRIRAELHVAGPDPRRPAVIIADSFGRPWRLGQAEVAIGCAGLDPLADWRGRHDRAGRELAATLIATADQLAAAADLVRDKTSGTPAVLIEGLDELVTPEDGPGAVTLQRPRDADLFR